MGVSDIMAISITNKDRESYFMPGQSSGKNALNNFFFIYYLLWFSSNIGWQFFTYIPAQERFCIPIHIHFYAINGYT